jgi:putative transcriptional regulator
MPKSTRSASASKSSKPKSRQIAKAQVRKSSSLGPRLIAALDEAIAHERGELALREYEVVVPEAVDVARLRARLGLSQARFARAFGLDVNAVQAWEQHRRRPDRTARILLAVIAREPEAVIRALAA